MTKFVRLSWLLFLHSQSISYAYFIISSRVIGKRAELSMLIYAALCWSLSLLGPPLYFFSSSPRQLLFQWIQKKIFFNPALHFSLLHIRPLWAFWLHHRGLVGFCFFYINFSELIVSSQSFISAVGKKNVLIEDKNTNPSQSRLLSCIYIEGGKVNVIEVKECLCGQMGLNLRLPCDAPDAGALSFLFKKK